MVWRGWALPTKTPDPLLLLNPWVSGRPTVGSRPGPRPSAGSGPGRPPTAPAGAARAHLPQAAAQRLLQVPPPVLPATAECPAHPIRGSDPLSVWRDGSPAAPARVIALGPARRRRAGWVAARRSARWRGTPPAAPPSAGRCPSPQRQAPPRPVAGGGRGVPPPQLADCPCKALQRVGPMSGTGRGARERLVQEQTMTTGLAQHTAQEAGVAWGAA